MNEIIDSFWHWLTVPDYVKVADRDLQLSQIRLRQAQDQAHYSTLMIEYYQGCIVRSSNLLVAQRTEDVATVQQAAVTGNS